MTCAKIMRAAVLIVFVMYHPALAADCNGVTKSQLAPWVWGAMLPLVRKRFPESTRLKFMRSLRYHDWPVAQLMVDNRGDDRPLVFIPGYPKSMTLVWEFAGIGLVREMRADAKAGARGIPDTLAGCFALWSGEA